MANEKLKMTVEMEVTEAQALALQAMFERWNSYSAMGSSRMVSFYADGDGNFHPNCKITTDKPIRPLTKELEELAEKSQDYFDFDPIGWLINGDE